MTDVPNDGPFTEPYSSSRDFLLAGLIGPHRKLYEKDPEFHNALNLIAQTVPEFVSLMAEQAKRNAILRERMTDMWLTEPPPPL